MNNFILFIDSSKCFQDDEECKSMKEQYRDLNCAEYEWMIWVEFNVLGDKVPM